MAPKRILITTFGSLGDLHPYLAVGQQLQQRGLEVTVGTQALFEGRVKAARLAFRHLRQTTVEEPSPDLIRRVFAGAEGPRFLIKNLLMPALETAWEDTLAAAREADLVITHPLTLAAPLAAAKLGLPWMSTLLAPSGLLSVSDPPVLPGIGLLHTLGAPAWVYRAVFALAGINLRRWFLPVQNLARREGLPIPDHPFQASAQSPFGTLALFPELLAPKRTDWPSNTTLTGFAFYRQPQPAAPDPALAQWLAEGEPPVIFTLGSSAVMDPGPFFSEATKAARRVGRRSLLIGYVHGGTIQSIRQGSEPPKGGLLDGDPHIFAAPYASYADLFAAGAAVVHQGGIGTTAEALRAGRPMLVVPFGVDQPDNAARVERLGVAKRLNRKHFRAALVARQLNRFLSEPAFAERARAVGQQIARQDGAGRAADAVVAVLGRAG